jgi:lysyl-tRNA synthetase class 1
MKDREVSVGLGDLLSSKVVMDSLGKDSWFYFRFVFADPRGLNLRNSLAHGTLPPSMVNEVISNLVLHSLLVLGIWEELADLRRA